VRPAGAWVPPNPAALLGVTDKAVVLVHQNHFRFHRFVGENKSHHDDFIARGAFSRGGAVNAHNSGALLSGDDISFEALAVVYVPNVDKLPWQQTGLIHQRFVYCEASWIVEVGFGYGGSVDFAFT